MKRGFRLCGAIGTIISFTSLSPAGILGWPENDKQFQDGRLEAMAGQTVMFSPALGASRPPVNYSCTEIELGYMVTGVKGRNFWRGNLEVAGSLFAGGIFEGHGNYIVGTTGWIRYNFIPPDSRFIPYLAAGPGLTEADIDHRIEGKNFDFNLNVAAGTRYLLKPDWSLNLECRYQHISNAHLAKPNAGVDAIGPVISVSYYF